MRKFVYFLMFALISIVTFAQTNPNRMVIYPKGGDMQGFLVEKLDSIKFPTVEGRVAADLELVSVNMEDTPKFIINVTRTSACIAFQIAYLPSTLANRYNEEGLINYVRTNEPAFYSQNFSGGELTGTTPIEGDTEYTIVTVGYDEYKTPCTVCTVKAKTPRKPLVGNPSVDAKITEITNFTITGHFTPNKDVKIAYALAMEPQTFEQQFAMFAPMFGFKNHGDMVKQFGAPIDKEMDFTWKEMKPNTEYRIYIQALDAAGTYAEIQTIDVTTEKLGGSGDAWAEVTLGKYSLEDWPAEDGNVEKAPTQYIKFTPNNQTAKYRFLVYDKAVYEENKEEIKNSMLADEGNRDLYETYEDAFKVQANSNYYAITVAQNADGKWGKFNEFAFTTGDAPAKVVVAPGKVANRSVEKTEAFFTPGKGFNIVASDNKFNLSETK